MPKRKRRIVPRQPNVGSILPIVQRMSAIHVLLAGLTVFESDEVTR
jgi:hypothetical protein